MSVIPCQQNEELQAKIREYTEILKTQAHQLGNHGLDELEDFLDLHWAIRSDRFRL